MADTERKLEAGGREWTITNTHFRHGPLAGWPCLLLDVDDLPIIDFRGPRALEAEAASPLLTLVVKAMRRLADYGATDWYEPYVAACEALGLTPYRRNGE